jgi:hypothetical protein
VAAREETNPLILPGKKPRFLGNQQRKLVNIPVDLSRLSSVTKHKVLKPFYDLRDSGFKPLIEIKGKLIIYAITASNIHFVRTVTQLFVTRACTFLAASTNLESGPFTSCNTSFLIDR